MNVYEYSRSDIYNNLVAIIFLCLKSFPLERSFNKKQKYSRFPVFFRIIAYT